MKTDKRNVEDKPKASSLSDIDNQTTGLTSSRAPKTKKSPIKVILISIILFILVCLCGVVFVYNKNLEPVDSSASSSRITIKITSGQSLNQIANNLKDSGLIKDKLAFVIYTRLNNEANKIKVGVYSLSPSDTVSKIISRLIDGISDQIKVTFYPGATLNNITKRQSSQRTDAAWGLKKAGFSDSQIDEALKATNYTNNTFIESNLPIDNDLEGLIYGDTYNFDAGTNAETVINRSINEMSVIIDKYDLADKFKQQNLTVYQGITLASVVQKEASNPDDQRQVAKVFFNRLLANMPLGSDVTYQYAADKAGLKRDYSISSPYNTRIVKGLPPGPICTPGLSALEAVAEPGSNDYLFFLNGDDSKMYYANTEAEHEDNIKNHCQTKCLAE